MTDCLAATGADPWGVIVGGILMVLAGVVVVAVLRRRHRALAAVGLVVALLLAGQMGSGALPSAQAAGAGTSCSSQAVPVGSDAAGAGGPESGTSPDASGAAGPAGVQAPGVEVSTTVPFEIRNAPADGYVTTERLWGGDLNNCVYESQPDLLDRRTWGKDRPAGTTVITGSVSWTPSYLGGCVLEPSLIIWRLSVYRGAELVQSVNVRALHSEGAVTIYFIPPMTILPLPSILGYKAYWYELPESDSGFRMLDRAGDYAQKENSGKPLVLSYADPITDREQYRIPLSATTIRELGPRSLSMTVERVGGSCVVESTPAEIASTTRGQTPGGVSSVPSLTLGRQEPSCVRPGWATFDVTVSQERNGLLVPVGKWQIDALKYPDETTLAARCTAIWAAPEYTPHCLGRDGDDEATGNTLMIPPVTGTDIPEQEWELILI